MFELEEAISFSKKAVWKWASASTAYSSLPLRLSRAVETEYKVKINQNFIRFFFL